MNTSTSRFNWKIAAAAGTLTGIGLGGFVYAGSTSPQLVPDDVILRDDAGSVGRLSAPVVVPQTAADLARAATINSIGALSGGSAPTVAPVPAVDATPTPGSPNLVASPDSPAVTVPVTVPTTVPATVPAPPPVVDLTPSPDSPNLVASPDSPAPAPAPPPVVDLTPSADSPNEVASPDSPASPASVDSPASPPSPDSADSPSSD